MPFTPEEQAAQLRKPSGKGAIEIMDYMNKGNAVLYAAALDYLALKSHLKVLEIGQGNGPLVYHIIASGINIQYTGLDYSTDSVLLAKEKNKAFVDSGQAQFLEGLIQKMPFENAVFDRVLGINVVYFWDNPKTELAEIFRVLKPGGTLVLGYRPKKLLALLPFANFGFKHYHPAEVESMLRETGFTSVVSQKLKEPFRRIGGQTYAMECVLTTAEK